MRELRKAATPLEAQMAIDDMAAQIAQRELEKNRAKRLK